MTLNYLKWVGGGTGREVKGEDCKGGRRGRGGGRGKGKGKGQLSLRPVCGHLGGHVENEENTCSAEWPRFANG